jgi:uncharacterized protein YceH (UPF0502 family)
MDPGWTMFETPLEPNECRVLGCLVEKQLSTPEYYPLTLNALLNACNQSSNRDPVLSLDEEAVRAALEGLRSRNLSFEVTAAGARTLKYEHRLEDTLHLSVQEAAILAELLLRGPQTPGELRARCARMYPFPDLGEVETGLQLLIEAEPPLIVRLPKAPGAREARVAHLLAGPVTAEGPSPTPSAPPSRVAQLETEVEALKEGLAGLRAEFEAFRGQFG